MARKCQSKNPTQCPIHGMGGKQEQLIMDLNKALEKSDLSKAVEIRQQIDSLSDTVESEKKEKASFFGRLKSHLTKVNEVPERAAPSPQLVVTAKPVSVEPVEEREPYTGLLADCGTCNSCDPPPSDLTHFRHLSNGTCDRPVRMPVKDVTRKVLSRNRAFNSGRTSEQIEELQSRVTSVLEDSSKSSVENGASQAAEEVRDMLWDDFSENNDNKDTSKGGFASAASTSDLFHALGREKEIGWIEDDAPGYGHQITRDLRTEALYSSMQQLLSESPSSYARKHEAKREQSREDVISSFRKARFGDGSDS